MKIYDYRKPHRDLNGTFAKKKLKTGLKLFIADFLTITVMGILISMQLTGRLAPQGPVIASNGTKASDSTIAINQAKQDLIQAQIDDLNKKLEKERLEELHLK